MTKYPAETTIANTGGSHSMKIVWQRDSLRLEAMALENADDMAGRMLKAGAKDMAEEDVEKLMYALKKIVCFYGLIYYRDISKPVASAQDFRALIEFIEADELHKVAWGAFAVCFAMAVPMQHAVNGLLAGQNTGVDRQLAQSVSYIGLMTSLCTDDKARTAVRKLAENVRLFHEAGPCTFMTSGPSQIVEEADQAAREWVAKTKPQKKEQPKDQPQE